MDKRGILLDESVPEFIHAPLSHSRHCPLRSAHPTRGTNGCQAPGRRLPTSGHSHRSAAAPLSTGTMGPPTVRQRPSDRRGCGFLRRCGSAERSIVTVLTSGDMLDGNSFGNPNKMQVVPVTKELPNAAEEMHTVVRPFLLTSFDLATGQAS
ncbi:hypothetical protein ACP4OV_014839 [Aristida adscensionis]